MPPPGVCLNIMKTRHKKDGYGSLASPEKFLNQDFNQLKQYCLVQGVRYIDEFFPPDRNSIGQGVVNPSDLSRIEWLRPRKIVPNPAFIVDGVSRFDFGQGIVGNCWFLASIGALTFQNHILVQVVPLEQSFDEDYCGLFHFRFWRFGRWVDVVIDDKLPTIDGRLIFVHSTTPNEFWPALLEKAYAKVCGSYSDMSAGTPSEALVDFTGGVHICFQLADASPNLWQLMFRAAQSKSLMGCGTPQGTSANTVAPNGLVEGHAYTVTGVKQVMSRGEAVNLVRLWNPWGQGEWIGDWSDKSPLWQTVSREDRDMCLAVDDDGEFWMAMGDFCRFFSDLDICSLCPDFLDGNSSCHWKSSFHDGRWVAGTTAGGCTNYRDSFWTNPQYRVKIQGLLDECAQKQGEKNMLVSLMQKPDKRNRRLVKNLHIGFMIYEVNYRKQQGKFPASFFNTHLPVAQTKTYMNAREVMEFFTLKPGEYLIVPSTFKPNETASFILSILSKAETHIHFGSVFLGEEDKRTLFRQYSDQYQEVDAQRLQMLLNEKILQAGGFSLDACRSMVALMDVSYIYVFLLSSPPSFRTPVNSLLSHQDIFFRTDVSRTGTLSLTELRNAIMASGIKVSDDMLNILALRYGDSTLNMTLESFINLVLRMDCMYRHGWADRLHNQ
uniref:Zgc:136872 n=1 Tax=Myripristis murdjan TaxID=586833 RepID=A0A667WTJ8_9TELE